MSKAAVYAGLGRGLMSLGQGIGKAIEVTAIEKLREENMRKNWARQDAMKAEDREFQTGLMKQQNARQDQLLADKVSREDTIRQQEVERETAQQNIVNERENKKLELLTTKSQTNSTPTETLNVRNMATAMGITEGEAWEIKTTAKTNPHQFKLAKARFVQSLVSNDDNYEFASPEEKTKLIANAGSMFDKIMDAEPAEEQPVATEHSELISMAQKAIAQGKDKNAVIQRLIEMGVPQDQINL